MKKGFSILLALLMLFATAAACAAQTLYVDNRETDKFYPERLNLRAEPSRNGGILGLYYTGAEVEALDEGNEAYVKVRIGGVTGYMDRAYLITGQEAQARYGDRFSAGRAAQVDLTGMWKKEQTLFEATDLSSTQLAQLSDGMSVVLVGILDDWAYIQAEAQGDPMLGYVPLDCLTDVGELKVSIIAGDRADSRTILYDAPNGRAKEIMSLKNGTACFTLFGRKEGQWRRVRVGGVSGWIKYTQTDSLFSLADQQRDVVPYYPLLMQAKTDVLLYSSLDQNVYMTLGREMQVELLAECGDYAYVRTLEGGAGAYDCGDFGYVQLKDLSLAQAEGSIGVAQVDDGDAPVIVLDAPQADAQMIGALCPGAQVRIVEYTQTDYLQVALGELRGYIPKDAIRVLAQGKKASERIPQRARTLEGAVLKNAPSDTTRDGAAIAADTRVYMLGVFGQWAFVQAAPSPGLDAAHPAADRTGFIRLQALNAPASTTHLTAFVNTDKVNLRSRASSTEGQIIGKARTGELLRVAEYSKSWSIVVTPEGKRGYIMTKYLDFQ